MLVAGELFPTSRGLDDKTEGTEMIGVEHLGQYVYEMTQAKTNQLNARTMPPPPRAEIPEDDYVQSGSVGGDEEEEDIKDETQE